MKLKNLKLSHFRNYQGIELCLGPGLTILTGENAQGKTNLLESIFLLSLAKSHRTNHDSEMIEWDQEQARIEAVIETKNYEIPLALTLTKKGKVAQVNYLDQSKLSHFVGQFNTVLFAPEDMQLIKGAPNLRRRFLDIELGQANPIYLNHLLTYQRLLKQRNSYLKQEGRGKKFDQVFFEILTEQLCHEGAHLIQYRMEFLEKLGQIASPIHQNLSNGRDQLRLEYVNGSQVYQPLSLEERIKQLLDQASTYASRERDQGTTLFGPHRDDFMTYVNDKKAQFFGSQGQQRTIVLSLKLAEIELIKQARGEYPVLLLDDVLSELDDDRQHILMSYIKDKVQTILTTATIKGLKLHQLPHAEIFYISAGNISKGEHYDGTKASTPTV